MSTLSLLIASFHNRSCSSTALPRTWAFPSAYALPLTAIGQDCWHLGRNWSPTEVTRTRVPESTVPCLHTPKASLYSGTEVFLNAIGTHDTFLHKVPAFPQAFRNIAQSFAQHSRLFHQTRHSVGCQDRVCMVENALLADRQPCVWSVVSGASIRHAAVKNQASK